MPLINSNVIKGFWGVRSNDLTGQHLSSRAFSEQLQAKSAKSDGDLQSDPPQSSVEDPCIKSGHSPNTLPSLELSLPEPEPEPEEKIVVPAQSQQSQSQQSQSQQSQSQQSQPQQSPLIVSPQPTAPQSVLSGVKALTAANYLRAESYNPSIHDTVVTVDELGSQPVIMMSDTQTTGAKRLFVRPEDNRLVGSSSGADDTGSVSAAYSLDELVLVDESGSLVNHALIQLPKLFRHPLPNDVTLSPNAEASFTIYPTRLYIDDWQARSRFVQPQGPLNLVSMGSYSVKNTGDKLIIVDANNQALSFPLNENIQIELFNNSRKDGFIRVTQNYRSYQANLADVFVNPQAMGNSLRLPFEEEAPEAIQELLNNVQRLRDEMTTFTVSSVNNAW